MKILKTILKILGWILGVLVLVVAVALVVFTIAEYRPADVETVIPEQQAEAVLETGKPLTIVSWNCGYGALGDNAEFFMDGGTSVYTADKERVTSNLDGIREKLQALSPDFIILQEVDINSSRSYSIDERTILRDAAASALPYASYTGSALPRPVAVRICSSLAFCEAVRPGIFRQYSSTSSARVWLSFRLASQAPSGSVWPSITIPSR